MGIPVGELQQRVSSKEFTEYLAYFNVEPWPEERADINSASIATLLANIHRDPQKQPTPFGIQDLKIDYWKQEESQEERNEQTPEQMQGIMNNLKKTLDRKAKEGTL